MADTHDESASSNNTWCPSEFVDKFESVSLGVKRETPPHRRSMSSSTYDRLLSQSQSQSASQTLWSTGELSKPIPNGFYSIIHVSTQTLLIMIEYHFYNFCLIFAYRILCFTKMFVLG